MENSKDQSLANHNHNQLLDKVRREGVYPSGHYTDSVWVTLLLLILG